jgi:hypothetical protein
MMMGNLFSMHNIVMGRLTEIILCIGGMARYGIKGLLKMGI